MKKLLTMFTLFTATSIFSYKYTFHNKDTIPLDVEVALRGTDYIIKGTIPPGEERTLSPEWYYAGFCVKGLKIKYQGNTIYDRKVDSFMAITGSLLGELNLCKNLVFTIDKLGVRGVF